MQPGPKSLLASLQLADGALPIGRFAHSQGLEAWLAAHPDAGTETIASVVENALVEGTVALDAVAVAHAHRAGDIDGLIRIDSFVSAARVVEGAREASESCGRQLARLADRLVDDPLFGDFSEAVAQRDSPGNVAVVHGALCRAAGVALQHAVLIELRGAAAGWLSVAVRLGRLSPSEAQGLQWQMAGVIADGASRAIDAELDDVYTATIELDVCALAHRRAETRFFRT